MILSPQQLIADQQAKVAQLRVALVEAEATLKGMEAIYSATSAPKRRSAATGSDQRPEEPSAGGRQPGAISQRWRVILGKLYNREEGFTLQDTVDLVFEVENRAMKPSEARRLMEGYEENGYVARNAAGRLFVTQDAARRFNFVRITKNSEFFPSQISNAVTAQAVFVAPPTSPSWPSNSQTEKALSPMEVLGTRAMAATPVNPFAAPPKPPEIVPASQWAGVGRISSIKSGGGLNEDEN